jgi:hypothetical protein
MAPRMLTSFKAQLVQEAVRAPDAGGPPVPRSPLDSGASAQPIRMPVPCWTACNGIELSRRGRVSALVPQQYRSADNGDLLTEVVKVGAGQIGSVEVAPDRSAPWRMH